MIYGLERVTVAFKRAEKLRVAQGVIARAMLEISRRDRVWNGEIKRLARVEDVIEHTAKAGLAVGRACGQGMWPVEMKRNGQSS